MKSVVEQNLYYKYLLPVLFFIAIVSAFSMDISDPDLPWHIATGKVMLNTHEIPAHDPFTSPRVGEVLPFVGDFVLSQYWFAQIVLAKIYLALGVSGLIFLRGLIFACITILIQKTLQKKGLLFSYLIAVGYVLYPMHQSYSSIRPAAFTFLFAAFVLYLLIKYQETEKIRYVVGLPFVFVLWGNMHGGYIFGLVILVFFLVQEILVLLLINEKLVKKHWYLFGSICLAFVSSFLNPNCYDAFAVALTTSYSNAYGSILENVSPLSSLIRWEAFVVRFWIVLPVNFILIFYFLRKKRIFPLLTIVFTTYMSLTAVRYIPFMLISVAFLLFYVDFGSLKIDKMLHAGLTISVGLIIFVFLHKDGLNPNRTWGESYCYSVKAASFLRENNIKGNIFASYAKSSFLLLEFFPESTVFVDPRFLYPDRVELLKKITGASPSLYKTRRLYFEQILLPPENISYEKQQMAKLEKEKILSLLDSTNADIVVHEAIQDLDGKIYNLPLCLYLSKDWALVYIDGSVVVYLRRNKRFQNFIAKNELSKDLLFDEIIAESKRGLSSKETVHYYTNLALSLMAKGGRSQDIEVILNQSLKLAPQDKNALVLLDIYSKTKGANKSK